MLSKYFEIFNKDVKKKAAAAKATSKKASAKNKSAAQKSKTEIDIKKFKEKLLRVIPTGLTVNEARPVSTTGFTPEGADLIIYKNYCQDLLEIFDGAVPQELVFGTLHFASSLTKKSLVDIFSKVSTVKKINYFSEEGDDTQIITIPAFIIASSSDFNMADLKNEITNFYISNNIEHNQEMDILMIADQGVVVKNWREKRSFIALETGKDTMMWFYILLNEYLEINKGESLDMRKYIKSNIIYPEY